MSDESADVVRMAFEALGSGGVDAAAKFWHPEIDWRAIEGAVDDVGVMKGQKAVRAYYEDWLDTMDDLRTEVGEVLFDGDDRVAVVVHISGRGRASGLFVESRYFVACTVKDGRIASGREYATKDEAVQGATPAT